VQQADELLNPELVKSAAPQVGQNGTVNAEHSRGACRGQPALLNVRQQLI